MEVVKLVDMAGSGSVPLRGRMCGVGPRVFVQGVRITAAEQAARDCHQHGIAAGDWLPVAPGSAAQHAVRQLQSERYQRSLARWIAESARRGIPGRFARHAALKRQQVAHE